MFLLFITYFHFGCFTYFLQIQCNAVNIQILTKHWTSHGYSPYLPTLPIFAGDSRFHCPLPVGKYGIASVIFLIICMISDINQEQVQKVGPNICLAFCFDLCTATDGLDYFQIANRKTMACLNFQSLQSPVHDRVFGTIQVMLKETDQIKTNQMIWYKPDFVSILKCGL